MAKAEEGQTVRIKRSITMSDGTYIRKATEGTIISVSGGWKKKYKVRWRGLNFPIEHVASDIVIMDES